MSEQELNTTGMFPLDFDSEMPQENTLFDENHVIEIDYVEFIKLANAVMNSAVEPSAIQITQSHGSGIGINTYVRVYQGDKRYDRDITNYSAW